MSKKGKRTGRPPAPGKGTTTTPTQASPEKPANSMNDNKSFKLMLVIPNNPDLSLTIGTRIIPSNTFATGLPSRQAQGERPNDANDTAKETIFDMFLSPLQRVYSNLENEVHFACYDAVKDCYHPTAINSEVFTFSIAPQGIQRYSFRHLMEHIKKDDRLSDPLIFCHVPECFMAYFYAIGSSILVRDSTPDDTELAKFAPLFSPWLRASYDTHVKLSSFGGSPYKSFTDSISCHPDGTFTSSITLFTALDADAPPTGKIPNPPESQLPSDTTTSDNGPGQTVTSKVRLGV